MAKKSYYLISPTRFSDLTNEQQEEVTKEFLGWDEKIINTALFDKREFSLGKNKYTRWSMDTKRKIKL